MLSRAKGLLRWLGSSLWSWARRNPRMAVLLVVGVIGVGVAYRYRRAREMAAGGFPDTQIGRRLGRARTHEERLRILERDGQKKREARERAQERAIEDGSGDPQEARRLACQAAAKGDYERAVELLAGARRPYEPQPGPRAADYMGRPGQWDDYLRERNRHARDERQRRADWEQQQWMELITHGPQSGGREEGREDATVAACLHFRATYPQSHQVGMVEQTLARAGALSQHGKEAGRKVAASLVARAQARHAGAKTIRERAEAQRDEAEALLLLAGYQDPAQAQTFREKAEKLKETAERTYFGPEREKERRQAIARLEQEQQKATSEEERAKVAIRQGRTYAQLGQHGAAVEEWLAVARRGPAASAFEAVDQLLRVTPQHVTWDKTAQALEQALAHWAKQEDTPSRGRVAVSFYDVERFAARAAEAGRGDIEARVIAGLAATPTPGIDAQRQRELVARLAEARLKASDEAGAREAAARYVELCGRGKGFEPEDVLWAIRDRWAYSGGRLYLTEYNVEKQAEKRRRREADGLPPMALPSAG